MSGRSVAIRSFETADAGVSVVLVARESSHVGAPVSAFDHDPLDPAEEAVDADLRAKLVVALFELNFLLSLAVARGIPVTLDLVERENPRAPGTTYQEVVDTGGVE